MNTANTTGIVSKPFVTTDLEHADAEISDMRKTLLNDIKSYVTAKKLTQIQAAEHLGIGQSGVSLILNGRHEKFSLQALVSMQIRIGRRVTIQVQA